MRVLVICDSHKDTDSVAKVMKKFYPDAAIHLGDGTDDLYVLEKDYPLTKFFYVKGNSNEPDNQGELERAIQLEGITIYLTHWHRFKRNDMDSIDEALKLNAQIILCGDSHTPELFFSKGIMFMNPGCISRECDFRTFGQIEIIESEYSCEVLFADLLLA